MVLVVDMGAGELVIRYWLGLRHAKFQKLGMSPRYKLAPMKAYAYFKAQRELYSRMGFRSTTPSEQL
jgi:hypothetical protein